MLCKKLQQDMFANGFIDIP